MAGRRGFTSDKALAHERFGEHALQLGEQDDAVYHFEQAIALYQEWGAHAKVNQLRLAHSSLPLAPPMEISLRGDMYMLTIEESSQLSA